jgi:Protein of unknown function (DUF2786)
MNIREKIAKILEKAKSTDSEAEAEMLLAKAMQMMEEHQIEAHELGDASDPIGMTVGCSNVQAGPPSYKFEVQRALAALYGCKSIRMWDKRTRDLSTGKLKPQTWRQEMVGSLSARVTTELMTEYVWDQLKALARSQGAELDIKPSIQLRKLANAMSYRVWKLVRENMARETPVARTQAASNALVLVKTATEAKYDELYPDVTTGKAKARTSNAAARAGAAGISLHRQTGGSAALRIGR